MNYMGRMGPPLMQRTQQSNERNFGTDLHAFMDGLNRIVQILYSSIPILELVKILWKYSLKFCEHLGKSVSCLGTAQAIDLERMWGSGVRRDPWKYVGLALAALIVSLLVLRRKDTQEHSLMQEQWEAEERARKSEEDPGMIYVEEDYYPFTREEFLY